MREHISTILIAPIAIAMAGGHFKPRTSSICHHAIHDVGIKHVSYHNIGSAIEIDGSKECQQLLIVDFDSLKGA